MKTLVITLFAFLATLFQSRRSLQFEIVALRHQLNVYQRTVKRPRRSRGSCTLGLVRTSIVWMEEFSGVCPDWDSDCLAA
jgi:hypothetical protein